MRILAIETSCDETAIALLEIIESDGKTSVKILGDALYSQIKIHKQYGGVFPMLAKREHSKNMPHLLKDCLTQAGEYREATSSTTDTEKEKFFRDTLEREESLGENLLEMISKIEKPNIDCIAVTEGPGLEPALWVGINTAVALSKYWDLPLVPINHMEGHIMAGMLKREESESGDTHTFSIEQTPLPLLALLISGGHTEIVLMKEWQIYEVLGHTKDDAVGEAFDKVARMLGLPYPGGPEISRLAKIARDSATSRAITGADTLKPFTFPRPMLYTPDYMFSFSGLKTSVLYTIKKIGELTDEIKQQIACEFEEAVTEVLLKKTLKAVEETSAQTVLIGGGVSANTFIRETFANEIAEKYPEIKFLVPGKNLSTDNAVMIGVSAFYKKETARKTSLRADGNLSL